MKFAFYFTVFGKQEDIRSIHRAAAVPTAKIVAPSSGKSVYGSDSWQWDSGYFKAHAQNPIESIQDFLLEKTELLQVFSSPSIQFELVRVTLVSLVENADSVQGFFASSSFITMLSNIQAEFELSPVQVFEFLESETDN